MLLWTLSGMVMVARPIAEVRGTDLLRDHAAVSLAGPLVTPRVEGRAVRSLALESRAGGARWVINFAGKPGGSRLADPATGALLAPLGAADAMREVVARYKGTAKVVRVTWSDAAQPPIDLRRPIDAWRVRMSDGTNFYVDAGSGNVVARRTRFWRFYDFMWGLHIMDLHGRANPHNPWVVAFAFLALVMVLMALVLLPIATRRGSRIRPD